VETESLISVDLSPSLSPQKKRHFERLLLVFARSRSCHLRVRNLVWTDKWPSFSNPILKLKFKFHVVIARRSVFSEVSTARTCVALAITVAYAMFFGTPISLCFEAFAMGASRSTLMIGVSRPESHSIEGDDGLQHYFRVARNPSRVDAKRGDHFLQADAI
jgi:hypothetical protein